MALVKARLKGRRSQRHMGIQRRVQLKRFRLTREVPEAEQAPLRPALFSDRQFILMDPAMRAGLT